MSSPAGPEIVLRLPSEAKLVYHAEGAANVVYRILVPEKSAVGKTFFESSRVEEGKSISEETEQHSPKTPEFEDISESKHSHHNFHGKLLRLRKAQGHATAPLQALHDFRKHIAPHFRAEELIHSLAVQIDKDLLLQLNTELTHLEKQHKRPPDRAGLYLKQESHGTIMDDLGYTHNAPNRSIFEIKPKWLLQSPDAPRGARRCRTCALRAYRAVSQTPTKSEPKRVNFCPLYLTSRNEARISQALREKFVKEKTPLKSQQHIVSYLVNSTILQRIKYLQTTLCSTGVLKADADDINFLTVMTLRDCSLFLVCSSEGVISAKLGDLDMKSPARIKHWFATERQLIDERWYEKILPGTEHIPCALEGS